VTISSRFRRGSPAGRTPESAGRWSRPGAGRGRLWGYGWPLLALAVSGAWVVSVLAQESNPFIPPSQREAEREAQLQQRVDKAVSALEARIMQSLVNSLEGKGETPGPGSPLAEALKKVIASSGSPAESGLPGRGGHRDGPAGRSSGTNGALPALPPLPGSAQVGDGAALPGSQFVGCLDRKAFFQDQSGSPFLLDPATFPPTSGPGACGR